ncbi:MULTISPECIES: class I SAM-dependent DNA methyltransferase [Afifella]|uniref:class I SAM-dependent DNA methyltransferase n=1 Tax=Afifella TaxID=643217 RepID=UPI0013E3014F|nr:MULTISPECIES: SAM-dependent methyltransferase [Afifella]MCT8267000.1 nodulation S family protein [Afifella sp. JA880]
MTPRAAIDPDGFEAKFRHDIDPWRYRSSSFEEMKRRDLVAAAGSGPYARGLELGCAIGVTSRALAPLTLRLLALDASPTALAEARRECADLASVRFREAVLPRDLPRGEFDLIVASEVAYYLSDAALRRLAAELPTRLARGGRIVLVHHVRPFSDAAVHPALAHGFLRKNLERQLVPVWHKARAHYRVDALIRP